MNTSQLLLNRASALGTRIAAAIFLAVLPQAADAQTPACTRLSGLVTDSTSALIPGALVTLDGKTKITTAQDARFAFPCVSPGTHTLTATFQAFAAGTIKVTAPHTTALTIRLVPSAQASITVNADDNMQVEAPGGGNGIVVSGKQLQQLADDPDDLQRELQQLAAASGGSPSNTTISVDGFQDDAKLPPKDSIAYINVSPDLFSAEYREPPFGGGRVEVYTKPGAKAFHGSIFATNSSSWMNASDPFSIESTPIGKQRYGLDFTGPIEKQGSNFRINLEHRTINEAAIVNAISFDTSGNQIPVLDTVPQPQQLWIAQARVDRQLGPRNIAFITYSVNDENEINENVGGTNLRETGYTDNSLEQTIRASIITTLSPKLMHEARISYDWTHDNNTANSLAPSVSVSGYFTGGGATTGNTHNIYGSFEYDDDIILTLSKQSIKTGFQLLERHRNSKIEDGFNGTYTYADISPTATVADYLANKPAEFTNTTGTPHLQLDQVRFAGFFQDDLKLLDNLHLTLGLRYSLETLPGTYENWDPRIGLAWSPDKAKTWQIKTHFGIFHGTITAQEMQQVEFEDGIQRSTNLVVNPTFGAPLNGLQPIIHQVRTVAAGVTPGTRTIGDLSISKDLPWGFNINAETVFMRFLTLTRTLDINQPLSGPGSARPSTPNLDILQVTDNGAGQGNGTFLGLSNFKHPRATFFIGALHLNIRNNSNDSSLYQPQSAYSNRGEEVRSTGEGAWQIFGNSTIQLPRKLSLSLNTYCQGKAPFNIVTGSDNNGDGNFNDRPSYAPPGTAPDGITNFATPWGVLTNNVQIVNGVPQNTIPRDISNLPWTFHLDGNIQRAFVITKDPKAEHQQTITANIRSVNFLNHTNVTAEGAVLGSPQFLIPTSADNARRIEFGLRYSF